MNITPIADAADPRLESYRHLTDATLLRHRGLFVAEGRLVIERVLADARYTVESLLLNAAALSALGSPLNSRPSEAPIFLADAAILEQTTGIHFHRGCLALVRRPVATPWATAVGDAAVVVVLDGVTNADNVGSVFRNVAAFGAGAVLLSPTCCDPLYRKAIRTSMGAVLRVPFARMEPWPDALFDIRSRGFTLVALSPHPSALSLDTFAGQTAHPRVALLVGTEGAGLAASTEAAADLRVRIPILPAVDSLNLAVATGIALERLCVR
jgi:tRNA G18 (ribose-2'-O)-methylase SpoU